MLPSWSYIQKGRGTVRSRHRVFRHLGGGVVIVKRLISVLGALATLAVGASTAYAAGVGVTQIYSPGKIVAPAQVEVASKATCDPGSLQAGFSFRLVESSVNGDTTGAGSSPTLTCDGRAHRYVLTVFASSGTW